MVAASARRLLLLAPDSATSEGCALFEFNKEQAELPACAFYASSQMLIIISNVVKPRVSLASSL